MRNKTEADYAREERAALRKKVGYEQETPQCRNCIHRQHRENFPNTQRHWCKLHLFIVMPHAVCDTWKGKDGSELES